VERTVPAQYPFARFAKGNVVVWADPDLMPPESVVKLFGLPHILSALHGAPSRASGLPTVWRWAPSWLRGRGLVVRQYAHGGLVGQFLGRYSVLFPSCRPMLREVRVALHARAHGVPTCRPVALWLQKKLGLFLTAYYITEEIPQGQDLLQLCRAVEAGAPCPPAVRQEIARAVAGTIAALHAAGIRHGDLNLKNLLVCDAGTTPQACAIDFKKARLQREVTLGEGLAALVRLDRSVVKWPASRSTITIADRLRVLRQYVRLRAGATADWKQWARRLRTRHLAHALSRRRS